MRHTAIDLYAGAGGLTQGLKQAGFHVVAAVEIDPLAVETYRYNHTEVRVWMQDITTLSVPLMMLRLGLRPGQLDLLAGCPPCQGFSTIRTHNGGRAIRDSRNDLIYDFLRFVRWLLPKTIMMENVPGLAKDRRFRKFCRELYKLNYRIKFRVENVADQGVPQRRRRLILIAGRNADVDFAPPVRKGRTVRQAIDGLLPAGQSGDPLHDLPERRNDEVMRRIAETPHDGGGREDLPIERQLGCHRRLDDRQLNGFRDVYGRMAWDEVAPTITTGCFNPSKGRFLHPEEDRAITLREAALLQSFPRRYFFSLRRGKTNAAVMIGNALPPKFICRHAVVLRRSLRAMQHR